MSSPAPALPLGMVHLARQNLQRRGSILRDLPKELFRPLMQPRLLFSLLLLPPRPHVLGHQHGRQDRPRRRWPARPPHAHRSGAQDHAVYGGGDVRGELHVAACQGRLLPLLRQCLL